ncbi:MAG: hypothetical protein MJ094_07390 [Saccharofermentans sp.]|nr:hypothetical protein [Saccharofermentans sp.]
MLFDLGDAIRLGLQIGRAVESYQDNQASKARLEAAKHEAVEATNRAKAEAAALENRKLAEQRARETVAVSCQGCGAQLGIRKNSVAFCNYCGSAIRVTKEGDASILSPEQRQQVIDREKARQGIKD